MEYNEEVIVRVQLSQFAEAGLKRIHFSENPLVIKEANQIYSELGDSKQLGWPISSQIKLRDHHSGGKLFHAFTDNLIVTFIRDEYSKFEISNRIESFFLRRYEIRTLTQKPTPALLQLVN